MLTESEVIKTAHALQQAEQSRVQIGLLSQTYPNMDMDDAYRIQAAWVQLKEQQGDARVGLKIGLTSKVMQKALNIDTPDSGVLLKSMQFHDGATIPCDRFIAPRIEAELAFIMKSDLPPNASVYDVLKATDYVAPALEILDTRVVRGEMGTGKARNVYDTISDNAANAGFVLGGKPIDPDAMDLRWLGAIVSVNAEVVETGLAAGVLNHPAYGLVWLSARLAQYGEVIRAGQVVLSGSFIKPIETPPGTTITADYGVLGTVSCHFSAGDR